MLDRLLRQKSRPPDGPDAPGESLRSHVFPRFLKWLSSRERPSVLDLGRLSGANIEIFARLGCRVQVEDLLAAAEEKLRSEEAPGAEPHAAATLPHVAESTHAAPPEPSGAPPGATAAPGPAVVTASAGANGAPGTNGTTAPGTTSATGRPTRHIVLPPRVFSRSTVVGSNGTNGTNGSHRTNGAHYGRAKLLTLPLPTSFGYPDGSFDAIVGWDLFNYYDPETARRLGADVVRLLRPGGMVFATYHARREDGPDGPGRHKIVDESHLQIEPHAGPPRARHLYQNRDIEKNFAGLKIVELYFLRHGVREMLLEKRTTSAPPAIGGPARPRPRFRIE